MKLKMVMIIILIWFGQNTFGQTNTKENSTQENNNSKKSNVEYSAETTKSTSVIANKNSEIYYSDKEWEKIKNQIKRNKKRITNSKNGIHSYKKLDTIYLEIKISKTNSLITDW
ncbi:hypothetical protein [uncultured Aquimarina sp.]|uniref:hypothetical protein n=1 Tax=uncultured Aquimarina sp. TaxID=575652 RepID=UPI002636D13A|nr:hypothetical protein [uncultured Aquimarina sp.]